MEILFTEFNVLKKELLIETRRRKKKKHLGIEPDFEVQNFKVRILILKYIRYNTPLKVCIEKKTRNNI